MKKGTKKPVTRPRRRAYRIEIVRTLKESLVYNVRATSHAKAQDAAKAKADAGVQPDEYDVLDDYLLVTDSRRCK